jgi:hypothetical protein
MSSDTSGILSGFAELDQRAARVGKEDSSQFGRGGTVSFGAEARDGRADSSGMPTAGLPLRFSRIVFADAHTPRELVKLLHILCPRIFVYDVAERPILRDSPGSQFLAEASINRTLSAIGGGSGRRILGHAKKRIIRSSTTADGGALRGKAGAIALAEAHEGRTGEGLRPIIGITYSVERPLSGGRRHRRQLVLDLVTNSLIHRKSSNASRQMRAAARPAAQSDVGAQANVSERVNAVGDMMRQAAKGAEALGRAVVTTPRPGEFGGPASRASAGITNMAAIVGADVSGDGWESVERVFITPQTRVRNDVSAPEKLTIYAPTASGTFGTGDFVVIFPSVALREAFCGRIRTMMYGSLNGAKMQRRSDPIKMMLPPAGGSSASSKDGGITVPPVPPTGGESGHSKGVSFDASSEDRRADRARTAALLRSRRERSATGIVFVHWIVCMTQYCTIFNANINIITIIFCAPCARQYATPQYSRPHTQSGSGAGTLRISRPQPRTSCAAFFPSQQPIVLVP